MNKPLKGNEEEIMLESGAGDGNRTRVRSLEGSGSTIELRPLSQKVLYPTCRQKWAGPQDSNLLHLLRGYSSLNPMKGDSRPLWQLVAYG